MSNSTSPHSDTAHKPYAGDTDVRNAKTVLSKPSRRPFKLVLPRPKRPTDRHALKKVAYLRYSYYDIAFKFFTEQILDAEYLAMPAPTKRTIELGSRYSNDFVCAPFKHILGGYIEALELGADVLVQFGGPCRLGYYGEMQESILRDLGYDFEMFNWSVVIGKPAIEYIRICKEKVNPNLSLANGARKLLPVVHMVEKLDEYNDYFLAHAGFQETPGMFEQAREEYFEDMRNCTNEKEINRTQSKGLRTLENIPLRMPLNPLRVGIVGEFFTAVDADSNLHIEEKLIKMGVGLARIVNLTNRYIHYHEANRRAGASEYLMYDDGPTSTLTIAGAKQFAEQGFDGIIHIKSSGCTPEIDCIPALQCIAQDYKIPILYLSFDSQTSDTGLDTRLEAFYDMIAMKKDKSVEL